MNQTSLLLEDLIDKAYKRLECMGYHPETLKNHWQVWQMLLHWSRKKRIQTFNHDLAVKFLGKYGIPIGSSKKPLSAYHSRIRTSLRILEELAIYGCWRRRRLTKDEAPFPPELKAIAEGFLKYREVRHGISARTLDKDKYHLLLFTSFMTSSNLRGWSDISSGSIPEFLVSQARLRPSTLIKLASTLRQLLKYLYLQGLHHKDLSPWVPRFRVQSDSNIPSVWQQEDVETLLTAVDRNSPVGKRDYAILILAIDLGLRAGEIRTLKLDHIRWGKAQLELFQHKTGNNVVLPLSDKVGQALIDYLRNGRPPVSYREVFIRHHAPLEPFADNDKLYHIISTYTRKARITFNRPIHRGLHSLRHTLATRMLEQETPMETIAAVLGHASVDTTRIYTKVDLKALRNVALDPEEVCNE